ncbi:HNH endonuclease, partial [Lacticaseibacillus casei]
MRVKVCRKAGCNNVIPYDQANPYCAKHAFLYKPNYADVAKRVKRDTSYYDKYKRDKESAAFYKSKI